MKGYKLNFMIDRIYENIQQPKKTKNILPKLVVKCENKKTYFANYLDICASLNRDSDNLVKFLEKELNVGTSVNAQNQLIIDGMFREKHIEKVIVNYIETFVRCCACKSLNTLLIKENRCTFLQCNNCNARNPVK